MYDDMYKRSFPVKAGDLEWPVNPVGDAAVVSSGQAGVAFLSLRGSVLHTSTALKWVSLLAAASPSNQAHKQNSFPASRVTQAHILNATYNMIAHSSKNSCVEMNFLMF